MSQVDEAFLSLAQSDVPGRAMLVSHQYTGLLTATLDEMIEKYTQVATLSISAWRLYQYALNI